MANTVFHCVFVQMSIHCVFQVDMLQAQCPVLTTAEPQALGRTACAEFPGESENKEVVSRTVTVFGH